MPPTVRSIGHGADVGGGHVGVRKTTRTEDELARAANSGFEQPPPRLRPRHLQGPNSMEKLEKSPRNIFLYAYPFDAGSENPDGASCLKGAQDLAQPAGNR